VLHFESDKIAPVDITRQIDKTRQNCTSQVTGCSKIVVK